MCYETLESRGVLKQRFVSNIYQLLLYFTFSHHFAGFRENLNAIITNFPFWKNVGCNLLELQLNILVEIFVIPKILFYASGATGILSWARSSSTEGYHNRIRSEERHHYSRLRHVYVFL